MCVPYRIHSRTTRTLDAQEAVGLWYGFAIVSLVVNNEGEIEKCIVFECARNTGDYGTFQQQHFLCRKHKNHMFVCLSEQICHPGSAHLHHEGRIQCNRSADKTNARKQNFPTSDKHPNCTRLCFMRKTTGFQCSCLKWTLVPLRTWTCLATFHSCNVMLRKFALVNATLPHSQRRRRGSPRCPRRRRSAARRRRSRGTPAARRP